MTPKRSPRVRGAREKARAYSHAWWAIPLGATLSGARMREAIMAAYLAGWRASQRAGKRKGKK
jgi:hypothetical protein